MSGITVYLYDCLRPEDKQKEHYNFKDFGEFIEKIKTDKDFTQLYVSAGFRRIVNNDEDNSTFYETCLSGDRDECDYLIDEGKVTESITTTDIPVGIKIPTLTWTISTEPDLYLTMKFHTW